MSLSERINDCKKLVIEVENNSRNAQDKTRQAKFNGTFFTAYSDFLSPILKSSIIAKRICSFKVDSESDKELKRLCKYANETFNAESVNDPFEFKTDAMQLADEYQKQWSEYITAKNRDLVHKLSAIKLVYPNKLLVQNAIAAINSISKWPLDENRVELYSSAVEGSKKILADISFDNEIEQFLDKINEGTASLNDLNDKVLNWIKSEKLEGNFILTIQ